MKDYNRKVVVVCPLYKAELSSLENIALEQGISVLSRKYDFYIIKPRGLALSFELPSHVFIVEFDEHFFKSIDGYNELLVSKSFYKVWEAYEYLLIYQLDCYVFNDDLSLWIERNYDFVGAPWFQGYSKASSDSKIIGVGNGGLSLRNVQRSIEVLSMFRWKQLLRVNASMTKRLKGLYFYLQYVMKKKRINEDFFWCKLVPLLFDFSIANVDDAISFAFECNPRKLYELNDQRLPFGAHAFQRYDITFWKEHIPELNDLNNNL